jgi:lipoprotein-anchoring transpeptidase ErfK/SrfK
MKIPADKETLLLTPKKKSDGSMNTGILTRNCWKTVNNCKFWFKDNGRRALGWWTVGKSTYYITKKTGCYKGIKQIDGKYYGFRDSGVMYNSGWAKVKDKYRYFKPTTGEMVRNASAQGIPVDKNGIPVDGNLAVDTLKKAQGYSSGTKHLILCDRANHKLAIYEGSKGNWKQKYFWICSVGKYVNGRSVTPAGVHRTNGYYVYRRGKTSISYYCTYIDSGNFIHSQQYYNDSMKPLHVSDGRMGVHITDSCIRVDISRAKWVYNNVKKNTTVVVYGGK